MCEVIAASDVAVTFDSGVLHVANCTETPIVALFSDNDPDFFTRMKPSGVWADLFRARFRVACKRAGLGKAKFELDCTQFRPPAVGGQLRLL